MQFVPSTGLPIPFKPVPSEVKFVQRSLAANIRDIADERTSLLRQIDLVSVVVAVRPSVSEKDIDVKIMLSAIVSRTGIKTMDP